MGTGVENIEMGIAVQYAQVPQYMPYYPMPITNNAYNPISILRPLSVSAFNFYW